MERQVLITGAGTLGTELAKQLTKCNVRIKLMDLSENALWRAEEAIGSGEKVSYVLGDIRDRNSVIGAMKGVSEVVHTAALKHVRYTNDNPEETINTNILGTRNLISEAARRDAVQRFVFISSDKATMPVNIYGESKRVGELLVQQAFKESGKQFMSCRFGNYLGSSGSVIDRWKEQRSDGAIKLTDGSMRRFFIKPPEVAKFVIFLLESRKYGNGNTYIPLMKVIDMDTMSKVVSKRWGVKVQVIGKGRGEKYDELLLNPSEASRSRIINEFSMIEVLSEPMAQEEGPFLSGTMLTTGTLPCMTENEVERYLEGVI